MGIEKLTRVLEDVLPPELGKEAKRKIETALSRHLEEMNIVTREQFDIQKRVLQKTRAKLDLLEKKLQEQES